MIGTGDADKLRHRQLVLDRLKYHLRLEISCIPLPLYRHVGRFNKGEPSFANCPVTGNQFSCDMAPLWHLADRHGLVIMEDAAEAHGTEYDGPQCGALGTLACFSFYANKIITTGEGGMVTTADPALADRLRAMRNLYFRRNQRFLSTELGFNYRLTNMHAAVGQARVERGADHIAAKRCIAACYLEGLDGLPLTLLVERP